MQEQKHISNGEKEQNETINKQREVFATFSRISERYWTRSKEIQKPPHKT